MQGCRNHYGHHGYGHGIFSVNLIIINSYTPIINADMAYYCYYYIILT